MTSRTIKTIGIAMLHELRFTATWVSVMRLVLVFDIKSTWSLVLA